MRAIVKAREGPGVDFKTVDDPEPGANDVVMRVKAVGICGGDISIYDSYSSSQGKDLTQPLIPGHETSGEIVKIGRDVRGFEVGDRIAVETHIPCGRCYSCQQGYLNLCDELEIFGITNGRNGAFADFAVVPSVVAYKIPEEVSYEEGALLEPLGVGVHTLERSGLRAGDTTAVTGCGPIGLFIISLLRVGGAAEIVATDVSDYRLEMARQMGATVTLNPRRDDVFQKTKEVTNRAGAKIVFEASGSPQALIQSLDILAKRGKLMVIAGHASTPPLNFTANIHKKEGAIEGIYGREIWGTWHRATELLRKGKLDVKPMITHRLPLNEIDQAISIAKRGEAGKILLFPQN